MHLETLYRGETSDDLRRLSIIIYVSIRCLVIFNGQPGIMDTLSL